MKMKLVVAFVTLFAIAFAQPIDSEKDAVIVRSASDNIGTDGYAFGFETSNGIVRDESATVKNIETENPALSVRGSVRWLSPEGIEFLLNYIADEYGFRAEGAHLPKP